MPASGMIVWAPLLRKSYFALVSWKQVTNLMAKFWWCLFCLASPYSMQGVFVSWVFNQLGSMIHNLAPSIAAFTCMGRYPFTAFTKPSGMTWWHQPTDWPPRSSNTKTVRMSWGPQTKGTNSAQELSVLTCDILNMTSSPTKKKTYLLKKYWQMFGGNCFFFWKIFRLKSCTYTYANKIIRAIFLIPWFPRILLGRVWPTNWHPGVSCEIAPTRPGRPWQEVILSATGGSSLVNVQRPCFPAVG